MKMQCSWLALVAAMLWLVAPVAAQDTDADQAEVSGDAEVGAVEGDAAEHAAEDHGGEEHADGDHAEGDHSGDDHGEIHVGNDPTHANISDQTWALLDFRTDMAFFSAAVFLLLLAGLSMTAWKPIIEGLQKREQGIAENIAGAERANQEAEAKLAEYEAKLASASEEAQQIVAEARKDAEAAGQRLIAEAQEEAARQRDRAVADIESAKMVALGELANQSTDVAMSLAQRVVGREVKASDHQSLIQEMLSKLPSEN